MPKVEIDEEELRSLQTMKGVLGKIAADPKRKAQLEQLHKAVDPNVPTPTTDQFKPIQEAVESVTKTISDFEKRQTEKEEKAAADLKLNALKSQMDGGLADLKRQGWFDDGIAKVKEIMESRGLFDVNDAVAIFERNNPPPPPAMPGGTGAWNFMDTAVDDADADIKEMIKTKGDSEPLLNRMVQKNLLEIRSQGRR
jgi:hypothetical protein